MELLNQICSTEIEFIEFTNTVIQWHCYLYILGIGPKRLINLYQWDVIFTQNISGTEKKITYSLRWTNRVLKLKALLTE